MSRVIPSSSHRLFFAFFVIWHPEGTALWHRSSSGYGKYSSTNPLYKSFDYYHQFLETATAQRRYRYQTVLYRRWCFHYDRLILSAHCTYSATVFGLALLLGGYEAATSHGLRKKKIYHQLHRTSSFYHRRQGVRGVIRIFRMGKISLNLFITVISKQYWIWWAGVGV